MSNQRTFSKALLSHNAVGSPTAEPRSLKKIPTLSTHMRNFSTQQATASKTPTSMSKQISDRKLTIPNVQVNTLINGESDRSHYQRKSSFISTNTITQLTQHTARPQLEHYNSLSPRGIPVSTKYTPTLSGLGQDYLKEVVLTQQMSSRTQTERYQTLTPRKMSFSNKHKALMTEPASDYVKETPINKVIKSLEKFCQMDDYIPYSFEGVRKTVSIRTAKRVMESLIDSLKDLKDRQSKDSLNSPTNIDAYSQANEQYILFEKLNLIINELLLYCDRTLISRKSNRNLDILFKEMTEVGQKSENPELSLYCFYIYAKSFLARSDYVEAIHHFKLFKELCMTHSSAKSKIKAYRCLGKCFQELQKYKVSLNYFTKFLQVAWFLKSGKHELLAYDYIGLQYYYLGELDKANHYHSKMVGGNLEPDSSNLKQIAVGKVKSSMEKENVSYRAGRNRRQDTRIRLVRNVRDMMTEQDDLAEVSSRDDDFELPIQSVGQQDDKASHSVENKTNDTKENRDTFDIQLAKISHKKKIARVVVGQMKAKVAQIAKEKTKDRQRMINGEGKKNTNALRGLDGTGETKLMPRLHTNIKAKLNEPIFVSHLSRNRQLKNFTGSIAHLLPPTALDEQVYDSNDALDTKSMEKIRRILEKFKINLLVVKDRLQSLQGHF